MIDGGAGGRGDASGGASSGASSTGGAGSAGAAGGVAGGAGDASCPGRLVSVQGRVLSPRGLPLANVDINLSGDAAGSTRSDENGHYELDSLCPGAYQITPSLTGLTFCDGGAALPNLDRDLTEDFTGSTSACKPSVIDQRLLVLIYDPLITGTDGQAQRLSASQGLEDPASLVNRLIRSLNSASNDHVRLRVRDERTIDQFPPSLDGFSYSASSYAACLADPAQCHSPEALDYPALIRDRRVCEAIDGGDVDEVWLLGEPHFGLTPARRLDPGCRRGADLVSLSYDRGMSSALADFQARAEDALTQAFGPSPAAPAADAFHAFIQVQSQVSGALATGCGSSRFAPNAADPSRFAEPAAVPSYCDAFFDAPVPVSALAVTQPVTCTAWGCSELGYRRYWFSHLPQGIGLDGDGKQADFWRYILRPDDRSAQKPVVCSSSYSSGWCDQISDGKHGECNVGEWATANASTGWVEFLFPEPKSITHVQLYDRACVEHVLSGHLELSDGSSLAFGALEDSGLEPTVLMLPGEKQLSSVRVVIDQSEGGPNPGFGEIIVE